jgi:hypothetical protein
MNEMINTLPMNEIIGTLLNYASIALFVVAVLTALTNIVVEVFKGLLPKLPTAILVFFVAEALTLLAGWIACEILAITIMWHYAVGAVVLGIVVAYAAMGNFDKLKEIVEKLQAYRAK